MRLIFFFLKKASFFLPQHTWWVWLYHPWWRTCCGLNWSLLKAGGIRLYFGWKRLFSLMKSLIRWTASQANGCCSQDFELLIIYGCFDFHDGLCAAGLTQTTWRRIASTPRCYCAPAFLSCLLRAPTQLRGFLGELPFFFKSRDFLPVPMAQRQTLGTSFRFCIRLRESIK